MNTFLQDNRRYFFIIGSVFTLDLITKLVAYFMLPYNEDVTIVGEDLYLYLTYNFEATGGQAAYILGDLSKENAKMILSPIACMILGVYIFMSQKFTLELPWKVAIGVTIYLILSLIVEISYQTIEVDFSNHFTSWFTKLGAVILYSSIFFVLANKVLKTLLAIILGCGLGNLINHFYPPYHIIDFMYSEHLYQWLKMGIFNFADVLLNATELVLGCYLIYQLGRKIAAWFSKPKVKVEAGN